MSDCACIYDSADGDLPEFYSQAFVKARKPHRCVECREAIPVGAKYERMSGKWDGDVRTETTCLCCQEIRSSFCCEGWTYGQLWEDIEEQMFSERPGGIDSACLEKLVTVEAKQFLQRRWWAWVESRQ